MNYKEYEILVDCCQIMLDGEYVFFNPRLGADKKVIDKIIANNELTNLSKGKFLEIASKYAPLYQTHKKLQKKQLEAYSQMSPQQIADLPLKDKINYIDLLFTQNNEDFITACKNNEDRIKACMFNMNFSKSFWDKEKQQTDRYVALVANSPDMMNSIKNWKNSSLDDKKQAVLKSAEFFKYVYGDVPEVVFFTFEEERAERHRKGEDENAPIYAAYYNVEDKKIHFNLERLQDSDNFFAFSVMLHEGTHFRQDTQNFEDPLINKIFHSHIRQAQLIDKNEGIETLNFYTMQPEEIHAHGLQEYAENMLIERTGVEKQQFKSLDKKIQNIHNKAFSMAKISQYKSSR